MRLTRVRPTNRLAQPLDFRTVHVNELAAPMLQKHEPMAVQQSMLLEPFRALP
jgi:hypothetical protein